MITIALIVNIYLNNQRSHNKAVAFEVMKDNYSHYLHVFYSVVCWSSFKIVKEISSKVEQ